MSKEPTKVHLAKQLSDITGTPYSRYMSWPKYDIWDRLEVAEDEEDWSESSDSGYVIKATKKELIDELASLTGSPKNRYKKWSKEELSQRVTAINDGEVWNISAGPTITATKKKLIDELANITGSPKNAYKDWSKKELLQRIYASTDEDWGMAAPSETKKSLVDELARLTGSTKSSYKDWSKAELTQRLMAIGHEDWGKAGPVTGKKKVKISSRSRAKKIRSKKKSSKKKKSCEPYQQRVNGRCVNKPCGDGKIRDRVTKRCRKKKR